MGGALCWRPVTSPTMVAILAAILDFIKNLKSDLLSLLKKVEKHLLSLKNYMTTCYP